AERRMIGNGKIDLQQFYDRADQPFALTQSYLKRVVGVNDGLVEQGRRDHFGLFIAIHGYIARNIDQWQRWLTAQAEEHRRTSLDDQVRVLQLLDSVLEIGGQSPLNDLAASNGSDPLIGAKADQSERGGEGRDHKSHDDRHRLAACEKGEDHWQDGGDRESDHRRQIGRIVRDRAGHHAGDNIGYEGVISRIRGHQDGRSGQSPKTTRRRRTDGKAPAPSCGKFRLLRGAHIAPAIQKPRQNDYAEQANPPDEHSDRQKVAQHVSGERGV